jgi:hypothetical protein
MYKNSPFKDRQAARADIKNPTNTTNGPGDGPSRLDRKVDMYKKGKETIGKMSGPDQKKQGAANRAMLESIKSESPSTFESLTGGAGKTESGKTVTMQQGANMSGRTLKEYQGEAQKQAKKSVKGRQSRQY